MKVVDFFDQHWRTPSVGSLEHGVPVKVPPALCQVCGMLQRFGNATSILGGLSGSHTLT